MTVKERILESLDLNKLLKALAQGGFEGKAAKGEGPGMATISFPSLGPVNKVIVKNGTAIIKGNKGRAMQKAIGDLMPTKVVVG